MMLMISREECTSYLAGVLGFFESYMQFLTFFLFLLTVLGFELRAFCLLGRHTPMNHALSAPLLFSYFLWYIPFSIPRL
jgi:ABC-type uncharacterized transport system permease subunit